MQNSERCVFPEESIRRFLRMRSTNQGKAAPSPSRRKISRNAISISYTESFLASSIRGAWLVGPTNIPENR